jgi:hypothetical protein
MRLRMLEVFVEFRVSVLEMESFVQWKCWQEKAAVAARICPSVIFSELMSILSAVIFLP